MEEERQRAKAERRDARRRARAAAINHVNGDSSAEETEAESDAAAPVIPKVMVKYDTASGDDPTNIFSQTSGLKVEWDEDDPRFFFSQLEMLMQSAGVVNQWTKRILLQRQLPRRITDQIKDLLRKDQSTAGDTPYLTLKTRLLTMFDKPKEENFEKAVQLVLTDGMKPSTLCKQIIDLLCECDKPLEKCCSEGTVTALWKRQLPPQVRAAVAGRSLKSSLEAVCKDADSVYATLNISSGSLRPPPAIAAAGVASFDTSADEPALQVAVIKKKPKNKGAPGKKKDKHPDGPPDDACSMHRQWGRGAYFCKRPNGDSPCPWKDITTAPPKK